MATTKLSDIIKPERLASMVPALLFDHMDFLKQGLATADYNNVQISKGGVFANIPFYNELTGADEVMADDTSAVPSKIATSKDIGVVCHRIKAWGSRDLAKIVSGDDPMKEAARQLAKYWAYRGQQAIINVLTGVLSASGPLGTSATNPHVKDVAVTTGTAVKISASTAIDALALLGQYFSKIDAWVMHSKVFLDAKKDDLVTYSETQNPDTVGKGLWTQQPYFLGKPVIVSDDVYTDTAVTNYTKYTTYGLAKGSLYFGTQKRMNPEIDRDILAKEDVLSCDFHFVPHVKLIKWGVSTENPANSDLATVTNWTLVATNHKFVNVCGIVTN